MTLSEYALKFVGRPYVWGGDGSGKCGGGFDCSGLVLEGLWALGLYDGKDVTAQGLHDTLCKKGWK
ncbi:MAG: C40 family peptidase, partial [Fibrobacter sp.]